MTTLSTAHEGDTNITDPYVPIDIHGEALNWDENDAHMSGLLYMVKKHYERKGLFQALFAHRAVNLSNGKIAVEDVQAVMFLENTVTDPRDFDDPCPPM